MTATAPAGRPPACTLLAFDYGLHRTGVACGNTVSRTARPLLTISATGHDRLAQIARLISEWQPGALVVGVPFHPDGAEHENTRRARRFARQLQGRFGLPVHEVDERYTTVEVRSRGAPDLDAAAAALLLEQFLEGAAHAAQGGEPQEEEP